MQNKFLTFNIVLFNCFTIMSAYAQYLDTTFDTDGMVITDFNSSFEYIHSIEMQADGKILVAGECIANGAKDFLVVRYLSHGSLDNSFGSNGKVVTDFQGSYDHAEVIAVQPDGKILCAGSSYDGNEYHFAIVRYISNGVLDNTFGTNGKVITVIDSLQTDKIHDLVIQNDGKIIVVGVAYNGSHFDVACARYNDNGILDSSFAVGGIFVYPMGTDSYGNSVKVDGNGDVLIGGLFRTGTKNDFMVLKLKNNGTLDTSFGLNGVVITSFGSNRMSDINSLAIQVDNKIVAVGSSALHPGGTDMEISVARYLPNGDFDLSFGNNGQIVKQVGNTSMGLDVEIQNDGKMVIVGYSDDTTGVNHNITLLRLDSSGLADNTFGVGGFVVTDVTFGTDEGHAISLQTDGKIVIGGCSFNGNNSDVTVVRYHPIISGTLVPNNQPSKLVKLYPNPASENLIIEYNVDKEEKISLCLLNYEGKIITYLIHNEQHIAGLHERKIDFPLWLPNGNYILFFQSSNSSFSTKITLNR